MVDPQRQPPVSVATVNDIVIAIEDPMASAGSIAEVVSSDPGLTARTLGLANSAFYGLARTVGDIRQAVALVGMEMVRTLAISGASGLLDEANGVPHLRDHALRVAAAARLLAPRVSVRSSDAFTAGLLHDIGELLLWQGDPEGYPAVHDKASDAADQLAIETDLYKTDHAILAAEHLFLWRLPEPIVDAVGDHHDPSPTSDNLTVVVAAADELAGPAGTADLALGLLGLDEADADALRDLVEAEHAELRGLLSV